MSETDFNRKATVVATAWERLKDNPEWQPILEANDLGFPYAYLVHRNIGILHDPAKKMVVETYDQILQALELVDRPEYTSFAAVLAAHPTNQQNKPT